MATRARVKKTYDDEIPESVFQARFFQLLRLNGFRIRLESGDVLDLFFHAFDSRKTIGAGLTDILAIHPGRLEVWFVELKRNSGRLSQKQKAWGKVLSAIEKASGGHVKYRVYRPRDFETIVRELGGRDSRLFV